MKTVGEAIEKIHEVTKLADALVSSAEHPLQDEHMADLMMDAAAFLNEYATAIRSMPLKKEVPEI